MRAPGSYHPGLRSHSKIEFQNCEALLEFWAKEQREGKQLIGGEREELLSYYQESEQELIKVYPLDAQWLERFKIRKSSTRNEMLKEFVSYLFPQVSRNRAERYIKVQFEQRTVATKVTLEKQLYYFGQLWDGMLKTWTERLSPAQLEKYSSLATDNAKDAFRIIFGWSGLARRNESAEFMIAIQSLAERLEVTRPGASYLIREFIGMHILTRTKPPIPRKKPGFFVWNV